MRVALAVAALALCAAGVVTVLRSRTFGVAMLASAMFATGVLVFMVAAAWQVR